MMMFLWPIILVTALVALVGWALRGGQDQVPMVGCMAGHGDMGQAVQAKTAIDILRERYARGEITKEQFEEMSHTIGA